MKISYSYGIIDLLNYGHMIALKNAAANSDLNIFGLVSDESSEAWFGSHVSNESERRVVLEGIKYIDEILEQRTFDPLDNLKKIHSSYPDAIITLYVGTKWKSLSAKMYIESIGGQIVYSDYYTKLSPQSILDILNKNESFDKMPKSNLLSTKANTLQALKPIVTKSIIEDLFIVTYKQFVNNETKVLHDLLIFFSGRKIVIRSSSKREDSFKESNAGHFTSILGVDSSDLAKVSSSMSLVQKVKTRHFGKITNG